MRKDEDERDTVIAVPCMIVHKKMLRVLAHQWKCSGAEAVRTLIEDAYAERVPEGKLVASTRRFVATDGRVYMKTPTKGPS